MLSLDNLLCLLYTLVFPAAVQNLIFVSIGSATNKDHQLPPFLKKLVGVIPIHLIIIDPYLEPFSPTNANQVPRPVITEEGAFVADPEYEGVYHDTNRLLHVFSIRAFASFATLLRTREDPGVIDLSSFYETVIRECKESGHLFLSQHFTGFNDLEIHRGYSHLVANSRYILLDPTLGADFGCYPKFEDDRCKVQFDLEEGQVNKFIIVSPFTWAPTRWCMMMRQTENPTVKIQLHSCLLSLACSKANTVWIPVRMFIVNFLGQAQLTRQEAATMYSDHFYAEYQRYTGFDLKTALNGFSSDLSVEPDVMCDILKLNLSSCLRECVGICAPDFEDANVGDLVDHFMEDLNKVPIYAWSDRFKAWVNLVLS